MTQRNPVANPESETGKGKNRLSSSEAVTGYSGFFSKRAD